MRPSKNALIGIRNLPRSAPFLWKNEFCRVSCEGERPPGTLCSARRFCGHGISRLPIRGGQGAPYRRVALDRSHSPTPKRGKVVGDRFFAAARVQGRNRCAVQGRRPLTAAAALSLARPPGAIVGTRSARSSSTTARTSSEIASTGRFAPADVGYQRRVADRQQHRRLIRNDTADLSCNGLTPSPARPRGFFASSDDHERAALKSPYASRRVDFGAATQCVPNMRNYG